MAIPVSGPHLHPTNDGVELRPTLSIDFIAQGSNEAGDTISLLTVVGNPGKGLFVCENPNNDITPSTCTADRAVLRYDMNDESVIRTQTSATKVTFDFVLPDGFNLLALTDHVATVESGAFAAQVDFENADGEPTQTDISLEVPFVGWTMRTRSDDAETFNNPLFEQRMITGLRPVVGVAVHSLSVPFVIPESFDETLKFLVAPIGDKEQAYYGLNTDYTKDVYQDPRKNPAGTQWTFFPSFDTMDVHFDANDSTKVDHIVYRGMRSEFEFHFDDSGQPTTFLPGITLDISDAGSDTNSNPISMTYDDGVVAATYEFQRHGELGSDPLLRLIELSSIEERAVTINTPVVVNKQQFHYEPVGAGCTVTECTIRPSQVDFHTTSNPDRPVMMQLGYEAETSLLSSFTMTTPDGNQHSAQFSYHPNFRNISAVQTFVQEPGSTDPTAIADLTMSYTQQGAGKYQGLIDNNQHSEDGPVSIFAVKQLRNGTLVYHGKDGSPVRDSFNRATQDGTQRLWSAANGLRVVDKYPDAAAHFWHERHMGPTDRSAPADGIRIDRIVNQSLGRLEFHSFADVTQTLQYQDGLSEIRLASREVKPGPGDEDLVYYGKHPDVNQANRSDQFSTVTNYNFDEHEGFSYLSNRTGTLLHATAPSNNVILPSMRVRLDSNNVPTISEVVAPDGLSVGMRSDVRFINNRLSASNFNEKNLSIVEITPMGVDTDNENAVINKTVTLRSFMANRTIDEVDALGIASAPMDDELVGSTVSDGFSQFLLGKNDRVNASDVTQDILIPYSIPDVGDNTVTSPPYVEGNDNSRTLQNVTRTDNADGSVTYELSANLAQVNADEVDVNTDLDEVPYLSNTAPQQTRRTHFKFDSAYRVEDINDFNVFNEPEKNVVEYYDGINYGAANVKSVTRPNNYMDVYIPHPTLQHLNLVTISDLTPEMATHVPGFDEIKGCVAPDEARLSQQLDTVQTCLENLFQDGFLDLHTDSRASANITLYDENGLTDRNLTLTQFGVPYQTNFRRNGTLDVVESQDVNQHYTSVSQLMVSPAPTIENGDALPLVESQTFLFDDDKGTILSSTSAASTPTLTGSETITKAFAGGAPTDVNDNVGKLNVTTTGNTQWGKGAASDDSTTQTVAITTDDVMEVQTTDMLIGNELIKSVDTPVPVTVTKQDGESNQTYNYTVTSNVRGLPDNLTNKDRNEIVEYIYTPGNEVKEIRADISASARNESDPQNIAIQTAPGALVVGRSTDDTTAGGETAITTKLSHGIPFTTITHGPENDKFNYQFFWDPDHESLVTVDNRDITVIRNEPEAADRTTAQIIRTLNDTDIVTIEQLLAFKGDPGPQVDSEPTKGIMKKLPQETPMALIPFTSNVQQTDYSIDRLTSEEEPITVREYLTVLPNNQAILERVEDESGRYLEKLYTNSPAAYAVNAAGELRPVGAPPVFTSVILPVDGRINQQSPDDGWVYESRYSYDFLPPLTDFKKYHVPNQIAGFNPYSGNLLIINQFAYELINGEPYTFSDDQIYTLKEGATRSSKQMLVTYDNRDDLGQVRRLTFRGGTPQTVGPDEVDIRYDFTIDGLRRMDKVTDPDLEDGVVLQITYDANNDTGLPDAINFPADSGLRTDELQLAYIYEGVRPRGHLIDLNLTQDSGVPEVVLENVFQDNSNLLDFRRQWISKNDDGVIEGSEGGLEASYVYDSRLLLTNDEDTLAVGQTKHFPANPVNNRDLDYSLFRDERGNPKGDVKLGGLDYDFVDVPRLYGISTQINRRAGNANGANLLFHFDNKFNGTDNPQSGGNLVSITSNNPQETERRLVMTPEGRVAFYSWNNAEYLYDGEGYFVGDVHLGGLRTCEKIT